MEIFAVLFAMCASAAVPTVADGSIPPDPVAPANDQVCLDLHAHYRTLIDRMSEQADACHAERPTYIQGRYGHDFSEGECARHVVEKPCLRRSLHRACPRGYAGLETLPCRLVELIPPILFHDAKITV